MVEFSLVLPVYNEAESLEGAVGAARKALRGESFEIIIAEDGSTDGTDKVAARLAKKFSNVKHLHNGERLGRGGALKKAFSEARGEFVAYMDADLATNPKHLKRMLQELRSNDVVIGSRYCQESKANRSAKRLFLSKGFNALVALLLGSKVSDHQCGFKGFRKSVAQKLCSLARDNHWFWDTEVLVLAQREGIRVKEIPVEWQESGRTKVNFKRDVLEMGAAAVGMRLRQ